MEECFFATCKYVDMCARNGGVFNPNKIRFGKREVDYAAFTITDKAGEANQENDRNQRELPEACQHDRCLFSSLILTNYL